MRTPQTPKARGLGARTLARLLSRHAILVVRPRVHDIGALNVSRTVARARRDPATRDVLVCDP
jgi:hypothetical protein